MRIIRSTVSIVALAIGVVALTPAIALAQTRSTTGTGFNPTIYLIIGAVMAVACGLIAKNKNRSVVLWAILGFLFGLIPLIIIAVLKKKEPIVSTYVNGPPPPPPPPQFGS